MTEFSVDIYKVKGDSKSLVVKGRSRILFPQKLKVGSRCCINDCVIMHCGGGIILGNDVTISTGSLLVTRAYDTSDWIEQCTKMENEMKHVTKEIYLADHTWIGAGAIILPGTRITGKGVIVGAGAVVSGTIEEDFVLVAGNPAKVVKCYN